MQIRVEYVQHSGPTTTGKNLGKDLGRSMRAAGVPDTAVFKGGEDDGVSVAVSIEDSAWREMGEPKTLMVEVA